MQGTQIFGPYNKTLFLIRLYVFLRIACVPATLTTIFSFHFFPMSTSSKSVKKAEIFYWISSGLLALFILPGIFFLNSPMALEGTAHLGVPEWLRVEVGIGSFIGGLLLILPKIPKRLKEWNYVALGIVYISAFIAHLYVDGLIFMTFSPLITLGLLAISYFSYHHIQDHRNIKA